MINCKMCLNKPICKFVDNGNLLNEQIKKIDIGNSSPFTVETKCEREAPGEINIR